MKAVILAGGMGTRLSEETVVRPKPMVEIGGRPILWHILKIYSQHGINDFIICCGYKGYLIKEYFANYFLHMSDVTFDLRENGMQVHQSVAEPWQIMLVDTGDNAGTGGRLRKVAAYLEGESDFCMTYGDGVSNLNISASIAFHRSHGKLVTVTAVRPSARFGGLSIAGTTVSAFQEKPEGEGGWINGGFFVLSPEILNDIPDESSMFEQEPMQKLASRN
jgi:glucose-1-phosphate cytidylyltransferase